MKKIALLLVLTLLLAAVPVLADDGATIVETALAVNSEGVYAGSFDILIAALVAEENVLQRLSGKGQYTVFAPTDDAFEALFDELGVTAQQVLADKELLSAVLEYHVANGQRDAVDVTTSSRVRTISKGFLFVDGTELTDANARTANIIIPDVFASNGVIHVIDTVVLP